MLEAGGSKKLVVRGTYTIDETNSVNGGDLSNLIPKVKKWVK